MALSTESTELFWVFVVKIRMLRVGENSVFALLIVENLWTFSDVVEDLIEGSLDFY